MLKIKKIISHPVVDFAAQELKKYLRMMMPNGGEIEISYEPGACDGFRLGLMSDFGIDTSEAADTELDDIIHIDTCAKDGILCGSNQRSVLFAVYRLLRENGFRWFFPGIDGEYIPVCDIMPVKYHKMAVNRFRGQCNEGSEAQENMMETIDWTAKMEMNVYMLEFKIPRAYYARWYEHHYNKYLPKEMITDETIVQWKRRCEVEIVKRGLQFHDMGHGWTCEPFGIDGASGWNQTNIELSEGQKKFTAMLNSERGLYHGVPLNTNFCMSNPEARNIVANYIADYAVRQSHVDFLHIWLADGTNNHCECDKCVVKTSADWYIILLNETDRILSARSMNTHLVFIVYVDTYWPPVTERLNNQSRFTMLFAPITRLYTENYDIDADEKVLPYERNKLKFPNGMAQNLTYLKKWKDIYAGNTFCYEYHFWRQHYFDPSYQQIAKILYKDIISLGKHGLTGIVEDMTQRGFLPTGFPMFIYANTLFDPSLTFEEQEEDYFSHAFGKDWRKVRDHLNRLDELFDFRYLSGLLPGEEDKSPYYNPEHAKKLAQIEPQIDAFDRIVAENINQPRRASSVSWQLIGYSNRFCRKLARACVAKANGDNDAAHDLWEEMLDDLARNEVRLQRYFDLGLYGAVIGSIFRK